VTSSPAIGSDSTVYVGSYDKKLYAIKTDSKGLAKSPWPMRSQNAQHTGRAAASAVNPSQQVQKHTWTNNRGQTIKAEFVSATNESVTLSMQGKTFGVKLADLSPQSRALALKIRDQKSTVQKPGTESEASPVVVDGRRLERRRDGRFYFEEKPFTGVTVSKHDNGQKKWEGNWKDGKQYGLQTEWRENGQKERESTYEDGEVVSSASYHSNGRKEVEITYEDGKVISTRKWDKDGNPASKLVIITRTGNHKNAGSDGPSPHAHIIGLDGSRSSLGPLDNIGVGDREAGSTDIYSLFFYYPVSKIQGIELVAKSNDAWRAKTISFQFFADGKKSKPYAFEVNQWFSAEKKDFREIGALKSKVFTFRPESNANHSPASPPLMRRSLRLARLTWTILKLSKRSSQRR